MELGSAHECADRRLTRQLNKIFAVKTISLIAHELGVKEDWLRDIANEMEPEDGLIWIFSTNGEEFMAFSEFGVENLQNLIEIHREDGK